MEPTTTPQVTGKIRQGVDYALEDQADALLAESRRKTPQDKEDPYQVLTAGQIERRQSREIYNKNGFPEPHLFAGLFRRVDNPKARSRPSKLISDEVWED